MNVNKILQNIEASKAISTASRAELLATNKYKQEASLAQELIARNYNWSDVLDGRCIDLARECDGYVTGQMGDLHAKRSEHEIFVPFEALQTRDTTDYSTTGSTGGYLIETEIQKKEPIAPLYPSSAFLAHADILYSNNRVQVPRFQAFLTGSSGEVSSTSVGQNAFATTEFTLFPIWYSNNILVSKQLLVQAAAQEKTKDSIVTLLQKALGNLFDTLALSGSGQTGGIGQALGVLAMTSQSPGGTDPSKVIQNTWGGSASLSSVSAAHKALNDANVPDDVNTRKWILSTAAQSKWRQAQLATSYPEFLINYKTNKQGPYEVITTTLLSGTNQSVLCNMENAVFLIGGGGFSLTVNPYTYGASGSVLITVGVLMDFGLYHNCAAVVSSDSAAQ